MPIKRCCQSYVLFQSVEHLMGRIVGGLESTTEFGKEREDEGRCLCPPHRHVGGKKDRQERRFDGVVAKLMAGGLHLFSGLTLQRSWARQAILVGGNMTGKEGSTLAAPELANQPGWRQWRAGSMRCREVRIRGVDGRRGYGMSGRVEWQPEFGQGQRDGVGRASGGAVAPLNFQVSRLAASPCGQKKLRIRTLFGQMEHHFHCFRVMTVY
jgi:hypothetical protein